MRFGFTPRIDIVSLRSRVQAIADRLPVPENDDQVVSIKERLQALYERANETAFSVSDHAVDEARKNLSRVLSSGSSREKDAARKAFIDAMSAKEVATNELEMLALEIAVVEDELDAAYARAISSGEGQWSKVIEQHEDKTRKLLAEAREAAVVVDLLNQCRARYFKSFNLLVKVMSRSQVVSLPIKLAGERVRRGAARFVDPWRAALADLDSAPDNEDAK